MGPLADLAVCSRFQPLKIKTNDTLVRKIEDYLDKNPIENLNTIKKYFDDAKLDAIEQVNGQLTRFREVHQMGKSSQPSACKTPFDVDTRPKSAVLCSLGCRE